MCGLLFVLWYDELQFNIIMKNKWIKKKNNYKILIKINQKNLILFVFKKKYHCFVSVDVCVYLTLEAWSKLHILWK